MSLTIASHSCVINPDLDLDHELDNNCDRMRVGVALLIHSPFLFPLSVSLPFCSSSETRLPWCCLNINDDHCTRLGGAFITTKAYLDPVTVPRKTSVVSLHVIIMIVLKTFGTN